SCGCTAAGFLFGGLGTGTFNDYAILANICGTIGVNAYTWSGANTGCDLANISAACIDWVSATYYITPLTLSTPTIVGLRMQNGSDSYYGWAELELGSLTLNDAAFNDVSGGSIYPGQVPEPSSLLLMLSGLAGLEALRRRRRK
ncbi:MAG: PEP-CTERM sorting domain-containing protein, partial [Armatimonadetes bacterium]|nr:PEP-CTERM sorting domain-containing protein [Armatimonadota bacterium]